MNEELSMVDNFVCFHCGCKGNIQEILCDCTHISRITKLQREKDQNGDTVYDSEVEAEWRTVEVSGGYISQYECGNCGEVILNEENEPINTPEDLYDFFERKMIEK